MRGSSLSPVIAWRVVIGKERVTNFAWCAAGEVVVRLRILHGVVSGKVADTAWWGRHELCRGEELFVVCLGVGWSLGWRGGGRAKRVSSRWASFQSELYQMRANPENVVPLTLLYSILAHFEKSRNLILFAAKCHSVSLRDLEA